MQLPPSQPPQDLPDNLRWRTVKVKPGMGRPLILAGEPFGCETHHPRTRTVPCYATLRGCTLRCPWCSYQRRFTCWVPVIDVQQPKQPRIVIQGGRRTWKSVEGMKPGDVIGLSRGTLERDTCLFAPLAADSIDILHRKKWSAKIPFDIRPYLFHLWQLRELSAAFGLEFHASIHTGEIEAKLRALDEDKARVPGV